MAQDHAFERREATPRDRPTPAGVAGWALQVLRELALQDWVVLAYLGVLTLAAAAATTTTSTRADVTARTGVWFLLWCATLAVVRGRLLPGRFISPLAYRVVIFTSIQGSYLVLRDLLPLVNPGSLDAELLRFDLAVFRFEPALVLDRYVTPASAGWFAFFYFGYFLLLAVHIFPLVLLGRDHRLLSEFALGMLVLYCGAQATYMLVPGYGPVHHLAGQFEHPLPYGYFQRVVVEAVEQSGAKKDIFPSLHTGGPVFLTLFSWRHRRELPFRWTWLPTAFFAANIVGATLFLRWHWLIDVVAGVAAATAASALAARYAPREAEMRAERGLAPVWPPMLRER